MARLYKVAACLAVMMVLSSPSHSQVAFTQDTVNPGAIFWGSGGANSVDVPPALLGLPANSNLDAISIGPWDDPNHVLFSIFPTIPPATQSDVLYNVAPGSFVVAIPQANLGLGPNSNLDGLDVNRASPAGTPSSIVWPIYFSVGRNDPSGLNQNNIYVTATPGGPPIVALPGAALQLNQEDNLDALELTSASGVPNSILNPNGVYFSVDRASSVNPRHIYVNNKFNIWRTDVTLGIGLVGGPTLDLDALAFAKSPFFEPPTLEFEINVAIPDHTWDPVSGPNRPNIMMSFKVTNLSSETVNWNCIDITASGSGNDALDLTSVVLYRDNNCDGNINGADAPVASGNYAADNGVLSLCPNELLSAGETRCYIIAYFVSPVAPAGATYSFAANNATGMGMVSGLASNNIGLPLLSSRKQLISDGCQKVCVAKCLEDGKEIRLCDVVVTCVFPSAAGGPTIFYVQEKERCSGIQVRSMQPLTSIFPCAVVDLTGTMTQIGCERVIDLTNITIKGEHCPVPPTIAGHDLGGERYCLQEGVLDVNCPQGNVRQACATHNIGLYFTIFGCVTYVSGGSFWVDDGSRLRDGTVGPNNECIYGVRVDVHNAPAVPVQPGMFVTVKGISSCYRNNGNVVRRLRVCDAGQIQVQQDIVSRTLTLETGWNLVSPCLLPTCDFQKPETFFNGMEVENGNLVRWDPCLRSNLQYDTLFDPDEFGGIIPSRGYWINNPGTPRTITYRGYEYPNDAWIGLPRKGFHLVGNLTLNPFPWELQRTTDICDCKGICRPDQKWGGHTAQFWEAALNSYQTVGCDDEIPDTNIVDCGRGFWYRAFEDQVAVIQPGPFLAPASE